MFPEPIVCTAVCLCRQEKVLLGQRLGSFCPGEWCFPGGRLELGESPAQGACREVREETGLQIARLRLWTVTSSVYPDRHLIGIVYLADCPPGEPRVLEPDRCACWEWFYWTELPRPLLAPVADMVRQGRSPWRDWHSTQVVQSEEVRR